MLIAPTIGKTGKLVGRVGLIGGIALLKYATSMLLSCFVCHFTLRNYHVYDAEVAYFSSLAI